MVEVSNADASILKDIDEEWDVDFSAYSLPFESKLLDDALDFSPSSTSSPLTTRELLSWLESDSVVPDLKRWKQRALDSRDMRAQIEAGFSLDFRHTGDTIDALITICFQAASQGEPLAEDAWTVTGLTAEAIVRENDHLGSPFEGMVGKGKSYWCYSVAVRLLITIYCDLIKCGDTYFSNLLGSPAVKKIPGRKYNRTKKQIINNAPISKEDEMDGLNGYNRLHEDYDWLMLKGKPKPKSRPKPKDKRNG